MDAYRHGDTFVLHFDLPGVDPASIDLEYERNVLTVAAERSWRPVEGDDIVANERVHGAFRRQLLLGDGLDATRMHASYENGVLTVTLPVAERAKPRKITVADPGSADRHRGHAADGAAGVVGPGVAQGRPPRRTTPRILLTPP